MSVASAPSGSPPTVVNFVIFVVAFIAFVILFNVAWHFSARHYRVYFLKFNLSHKADWCSRVNSTVHALIIVPGFLFTVSMVHWRDSKEPDSYNDIQWVHVFLDISVAYFLSDLIVIIVYRVPMWMVFVTHHVVAVIPLAINVFDSDCPNGTYIMALFMLVEVPTLSLNMQSFLEQTGRAGTREYAICFYCTYFFWIICRIGLPLYLIITIWVDVLPSTNSVGCLTAGVISAHMITLFCLGVFYFVLTKEVRSRWKTTPAPMEVANVMPGVEGGVPMDAAPEFIGSFPPDRPEDVEAETSPRMPSYKGEADVEWGLGIDRPASVLRYGGAGLR
eukprot:PhF_6_TR30422/c0_g1_i1/m.44630